MTDSQSLILSWYQATIWDLWPVFLSLSWKLYLDSWRIVLMGRHLWWEEGSVIYSCCWALQSFLGLSATELMNIFYCLNFETLQLGGTRFPYLFPPGTGCSSYIRDIGFHVCCLLWLAGLWWKYSNLPPHTAKLVKSKSSYDWQSVSQSVLESVYHLGPATNFSFPSTEILLRLVCLFIMGHLLWWEDMSVIFSAVPP
jgi:hypothetical protein